MNSALILQINVFCAVFMTGLIWLVQLVHYPSFRFVDAEHFSSFQKFHSNTITFIVGPVMMTELVTAAWLLYYSYSFVTILNLASVVTLFILTAVFSVPLHTKLSSAKDEQTIRLLILTNWPRTIMWTLRALLLMCYIY